MSVITAIEPQKKRGDRRSIYVDGAFVAGAHEEVVAALGLAVGREFEPELLERILRAETAKNARERALRLLSFRSRTVSELRRRLIGSDFPEDIVEEVVKQLSERGLLDDDRFSKDWVRSRTGGRPMGRARLAWELRSKGVDPSTVEAALDGLDEDAEYELALSCARKKAEKADPSDPSFRNRLGSFLRRRGFGWEVIRRVFDQVCPTDEDA